MEMCRYVALARLLDEQPTSRMLCQRLGGSMEQMKNFCRSELTNRETNEELVLRSKDHEYTSKRSSRSWGASQELGCMGWHPRKQSSKRLLSTVTLLNTFTVAVTLLD